MKKHLKFDVTANHVLSQGQFPADHETPTADLGMRPVEPWEETHLRKTSREVDVDATRRVPHSRIRAGQMVVSTHRVQDIAAKGPDKFTDNAPIEGRQLPDGDVMLLDGHHRVVADMLRGKKTSKVYIGSRWEQP